MSAPPVIVARHGLAVINPFYLPRIHEVTAPDAPVIDLESHECCFCLRPLGEGPGTVSSLATCRVTDEDGKPWIVVLCNDCFARADAREERRSHDDRR
jgi:hypothetical protein